MSDKLLNMLGSLHEQNWDYNTSVLPVQEEDYDYVINCTKYFDVGRDTDFDFTDFLELLTDYQDVDIHSYVRDEPPFKVDADGIYRHVVEIQVKE